MRKATYHLSGNVEPMGVIFGCAAGLAAGFPLAFVYAWGIIQIDEQKMAAIATLVYGAALGAAPACAMKWGKVRNIMVASVVALATAAGSLYCSWAFWAKNILKTFEQGEVDAFSLMQKPHSLWELVKLINEYGTWGTTKDSPTKGAELWAIWGLEALVVLGIAVTIAIVILESQPFCESCKLWCSASEKLFLWGGENPVPLQRCLETGDLSFIQKLSPGNAKTTHLSAHLHSCPSCGGLNTLTLQHTLIKPAKSGKPKITHTTLGKKLLISHQEADILRNTAQNHKQMAQAAKA